MQPGFKCDSYSCLWKQTVSDSPPPPTAAPFSAQISCSATFCLLSLDSLIHNIEIVNCFFAIFLQPSRWWNFPIVFYVSCEKAGVHFLLVFFSLVRWLRTRTWRLPTWITNRKQVSLPVTYMQESNKQIFEARSFETLLCSKNTTGIWSLYTVPQESVNCGFNWTMSNLPFFLKRSLSVWLQSFFFVSSTKASFPTESVSYTHLTQTTNREV